MIPPTEKGFSAFRKDLYYTESINSLRLYPGIKICTHWLPWQPAGATMVATRMHAWTKLESLKCCNHCSCLGVSVTVS